MIPGNKTTLLTEYNDIEIDSKGFVVLRKKPNSNNWLLFIDGQLVQEIRTARAMSFLDGWKLSANVQGQKPIAHLISEEPK